ncbi:hypothetical protein glysoja_046705 [Glycine soja]|uniref:Uncharacterized protein n=1 Tax=Glycine soja TaxID=3848 RepID=A0A0B2R856_GLYSO|nr:hypothetical protein glysoja_046705 [Glycine soja]
MKVPNNPIEIQNLLLYFPLSIICFYGLFLLIILFLFVWLKQRNLKGTTDFLQKRDIPYTLRCTPLLYEVVSQPQLFKDKGIPNGFVEMEKRQER